MTRTLSRRILTVSLVLVAALLAGAGSALLGVCGPFTDVSDAGFCPFVLEIFYLGITTGTTPTTFDPGASVSRLQMAAFLSRTVDRVLTRGSRRAALAHFGTYDPQYSNGQGLTTVGQSPFWVASDGKDLWVSNNTGTVSRVRASDGRLLQTWTGAESANAVLLAMGRVLVSEWSGFSFDGRLFMIDPSQPPGAVTTVVPALGSSRTLTYDGSRIWAGHTFPACSRHAVSIVTPGASIPWTVTTVTSASFHCTEGLVFDGSNVWVADTSADGGRLLRLDATGSVLQTVTVGPNALFPVFDGANIWVPMGNSGVSVVHASTGAVLATLTGLTGYQASFDGERVLVTTLTGVALYKAADLTPLGNFNFGFGFETYGACSDGVNFWLTLPNADKLARF